MPPRKRNIFSRLVSRTTSLDINVERDRSRIHVQLFGELDLEHAGALRARLEEVETGRPNLLVLDLRGLEFMDSTGLREVLGAVRRGRDEGRRVVLVKAHGPIEDLLNLTKVAEMAETVDDPGAVGFPDNGA